MTEPTIDLQRTDSGAGESGLSIADNIKSVIDTKAKKPQYIVLVKNGSGNSYIPYSWGNRELVRRTLDESDAKKWARKKSRFQFYSTILTSMINSFINNIIKHFSNNK